MSVDNQFNVAGKLDKKQIAAEEERKRRQNIQKIVEKETRNKAFTLIKEREEMVSVMNAEAQRKIEIEVKREAVRQNANKANHDIKPPPGVPHKKEKPREEYIKTIVRNRFGRHLEEGIEAAKTSKNKEIDAFVSKALEQQQDRQKPTRQQFKEDAQRVTTNRESRNTGRDSGRQSGRNQTRGRGRD